MPIYHDPFRAFRHTATAQVSGNLHSLQGTGLRYTGMPQSLGTVEITVDVRTTSIQNQSLYMVFTFEDKDGVVGRNHPRAGEIPLSWRTNNEDVDLGFGYFLGNVQNTWVTTTFSFSVPDGMFIRGGSVRVVAYGRSLLVTMYARNFSMTSNTLRPPIKRVYFNGVVREIREGSELIHRDG